jgi:hypothetical protein
MDLEVGGITGEALQTKMRDGDGTKWSRTVAEDCEVNRTGDSDNLSATTTMKRDVSQCPGLKTLGGAVWRKARFGAFAVGAHHCRNSSITPHFDLDRFEAFTFAAGAKAGIGRTLFRPSVRL